MDPNQDATLAHAASEVDNAIKRLRDLGYTDQAADLVATAAEQAAAKYKFLAEDTDHSDTWKLQQYARQYIAVMTDLSHSLSALMSSAGGQDQDDAERVFGTKGLSGDAASLTISRRHAAAAVEDITDGAVLQRQLERAARTGDHVLSRAIAEKAVVEGYVDVAKQFQTAYPDLSEAVARLWTTQHGKITTASLNTFFHVASLKPAAIRHLQPYEIDAAAIGRTDIGRWNAGA